MSTSLAFSRKLFIALDGTPMTFNVSRCKNVAELEEYIEFGGGLVVQSRGPFTVMLEDEDAAQDSSRVKQESFKSDFIIQCCSRNKILPLTQFRCNSISLFSDDFDPNHVLHHKISWENAEQQYKKASDMSDSEPNVSLDENQYPLTKSNGPKIVFRGRTEFTHLERQKIVQFIVKSKSFTEVRGTALWKRMSLTMKHHTWQSLKEHFMKKILPLIHSYNLSAAEIKYFRLGAEVQATSKPKKNTSGYSVDEDNLILKYVSRHANFNTPLGGNQFWKDMQNNHYIKGRTWQSVRERYLKHLKDQKLSDESESEEETAAGCSSVPSLEIPSSTSCQKETPAGCSTEKSVPSPEIPSSTSCQKDTAAGCSTEKSVPSPEIPSSTSDQEDLKNVQGKLLEPSRRQKRKLFSMQSSPKFSPVIDNVARPSSMEKKFNNTKVKKFVQLISVSTDDEDNECGNKDANPSGLQDSFIETSDIDPPLEIGTQEGACINEGVDLLSAIPINQNSTPSKIHKEADESLENCSLKSDSSGQETNTEWPSNFPPEQVIFNSDCVEVPIPENSNSDANDNENSEYEDSEWSDDGLFWKGPVVFPDGMRVKNNPVAHLQAVKCNNDRQGNNCELMEMESEKQCETNKADQTKMKVQDGLEAKTRDRPNVNSTNFKALLRGTTDDSTFNFMAGVVNSLDESELTKGLIETGQLFSQSTLSEPILIDSQDYRQQISNPTLQDTNFEEPHVSNICEKSINNEFRSVAVQVTPPYKRHVAVQTDPVLLLPKGWRSLVPSLPSSVPTTLPSVSGCVSPVPANVP